MNHPTPRELQVLELVSHGHRNIEIGAKLHLSEDTVKTHLRRLMRKYEVGDRAHCVRVGFERGHLVPAGNAACGPCSRGAPILVAGLCAGHERVLWARLWNYLPRLPREEAGS